MLKKIFTTTASILLLSFNAHASTLPDADISQKFGIGTGPSISADFKLNNRTSLGVSLGSPIYRGIFTSGLYDVRLLYKFLDQNKFALSGLIGVTGNPAFNLKYAGSLIGVEAGIALSYQFTSQVTGRLNLVTGVPIDTWGKWNSWYSFASPASGIEIGYKFTPTIEGTIGANGQGDFLGLNIYF